jgi:hypothetical protein
VSKIQKIRLPAGCAKPFTLSPKGVKRARICFAATRAKKQTPKNPAFSFLSPPSVSPSLFASILGSAHQTDIPKWNTMTTVLNYSVPYNRI